MNYEEMMEQARDRGEAAGSWVLDGNSTTAHALHILRGYEDGDPEVMDLEPAPLSGEYAGESIPELGLADADDETLNAYEGEYSKAFWAEVLESARVIVGEE